MTVFEKCPWIPVAYTLKMRTSNSVQIVISWQFPNNKYPQIILNLSVISIFKDLKT